MKPETQFVLWAGRALQAGRRRHRLLPLRIFGNRNTEGRGGETPSCLELTVRMLNINHGRNGWLTACCERLDEYSYFVDCIRECRDSGLSADQAIDSAVAHCIDHGIMEDILLPMRAEVKKMLLTEYNERKYMKMFRKEAREEGLAEGLAEGNLAGQRRLPATMLQNGVPAE